MDLIFAWLGAMAVTAIAVAGGRAYAARLGLVDSPDDRKKHVGDVPLVGGIAIYVGISVLLLVTGQFAEAAAKRSV